MSKSKSPVRGDADGKSEFEALWIENRGKVLAFCRKKSSNRQEAEEVFAETFSEAGVHFAEFRHESSFSTWAIAIARGLIAHRRRGRRKPGWQRQLGQNDENVADRRQPAVPDAADRLARLAGEVPAALESGHLTRLEADILLARLPESGRSWSEIGRSFGRTAANCRDLFRRAKTSLCVYLVVHPPDFLGGPPAIAHAFQEAKADKESPLTPREAHAFEEIVIARRIDHHDGWRKPFRSACGKVCAKMGLANVAHPPNPPTHSVPSDPNK